MDNIESLEIIFGKEKPVYWMNDAISGMSELALFIFDLC